MQPTDAGVYMVTVANASGTVTSTPVALTIQSLLVPPAITAQPLLALVTAGGSVSFTVGASGSAPLAYQWMVGSVPIAGATSATFALPSVKLTDGGTYSAVVTNAAGRAVTTGALLDRCRRHQRSPHLSTPADIDLGWSRRHRELLRGWVS